MPRTAFTFDEAEIAELIDEYLAKRGMARVGAITINHCPGDRPGELSSTTISVEARLVSAEGR